MKILAVNGSPRGQRGNTEVLVQPFLEGAREAGAESETVYLNTKRIEHCTGCFGCWLKTPGVCIHDDDMPELLRKTIDSDVIVYATPLYIYTVSGLMKDFMDPPASARAALCRLRGRYVQPPCPIPRRRR